LKRNIAKKRQGENPDYSSMKPFAAQQRGIEVQEGQGRGSEKPRL
jgi:hypothetical protein